MDAWNTIDRLMIISSDAHAGALPEHYRDYLPSKWLDEFDAWLAQLTMPWFDITDNRNWDSAATDPRTRRRGRDRRGHLPEHAAALLRHPRPPQRRPTRPAASNAGGPGSRRTIGGSSTSAVKHRTAHEG